MPVRSVTSAYYSEDRTIGATGTDEVTLTQPCTAVIVMLKTNVGDEFTLILNEGEAQGEGPKDPVTLNAGTVFTLDNWRIRKITVTSTNGAEWSYMAFVKPFTGLGFSEVT